MMLSLIFMNLATWYELFRLAVAVSSNNPYHQMHELMSKGKFTPLAGTNVQRDFVEVRTVFTHLKSANQPTKTKFCGNT